MFPGFWFVLLFWGETATLLTKLGLCFLSQHAYFSQVVSGPERLSGLASQPHISQSVKPGQTKQCHCLATQHSLRPAPTSVKPAQSMGGAGGVTTQMDVPFFFLLPSHPLPPHPPWGPDAPPGWRLGQGTCQAFRISSHSHAPPSQRLMTCLSEFSLQMVLSLV